MNVFIWKKLLEIKKNKQRLMLFLGFPIIFFMILKIKNLNNNLLFGFFPLVVTLFSTIIHFKVDDLIHCEIFLATKFSIRQIWVSNILFNCITSYIYSNIILCIYYFYTITNLNISISSLIMNLSTLITIVALIGSSTIHFSSYSKVTQLIASVFAIINIISPFFLIFLGSKLIISYNVIYINIFTSGFIFLTCYIFILFSNKEKLLFNTENYVKIYNHKFLND